MSKEQKQEENDMNEKTKKITYIGLLTAIVVVLQLVASQIRLGPFSITLCLVPIIVGAALYGWKAGAWLGFVFSFLVLLTDAGAFLAVSVPGTIITVILKGTCCGIVAALVFAALEKVNSFVAVVVAGIAAPVTNTGLFLLGCLVFFMPTINEWAAASGFPNAGNYLIFGMVGINFVIELAVNMILAAVIVQIIGIAKKNNNK